MVHWLRILALPATSTNLKDPQVGRLFFVSWLLGVLLFAALMIHVLGIWPLAWTRMPITEMTQEHKWGYLARLPTRSYDIFNGSCPGQVYENGVPLPMRLSTGRDAVNQYGMGRYYLDDSWVCFSATDATHPTTNGRQYMVEIPFSINANIPIVVGAIVIFSSLYLLVKVRQSVVHFLYRPCWVVPFALFALLFVAGRLWIFIDYPIAGIHPDSGWYFLLSEKIQQGNWPSFEMRPPVVPLFWTFAFLVCDRVMSVVFFQSLLSFLAGASLVKAIHVWKPWLSLWAAFAMGTYYSSLISLEHDTSLLSESIYTSFVIFSITFLILGLYRMYRFSIAALALSSSCMALAILARPAGQFFLVLFVLIGLFLGYNRYGRKAIISFLSPFPLLLLLCCSYNYLQMNSFVISAAAPQEITFVTNFYWETDPDYPPAINVAIRKVQDSTKTRFTKEELHILESTYDFPELYRIYLKGHYYVAHEAIADAVKKDATLQREWLMRISLDAVKKHPVLFFKHFLTMMIYQFKGVKHDYDFRVYLKLRTDLLYVRNYCSVLEDGNDYRVRLGKEFAGWTPPEGVHVVDKESAIWEELGFNNRILVKPTSLWRIYYTSHRVRKIIFPHTAWSLGLLLALVASFVAMIRRGATDVDAFIVLVCGLAVIGAHAIVSLVEYAQPRYSYSVEWMYFICVPMIPSLLFRRPENTGQMFKSDCPMNTTGVQDSN